MHTLCGNHLAHAVIVPARGFFRAGPGIPSGGRDATGPGLALQTIKHFLERSRSPHVRDRDLRARSAERRPTPGWALLQAERRQLPDAVIAALRSGTSLWS